MPHPLVCEGDVVSVMNSKPAVGDVEELAAGYCGAEVDVRDRIRQRLYNE